MKKWPQGEDHLRKKIFDSGIDCAVNITAEQTDTIIATYHLNAKNGTTKLKEIKDTQILEIFCLKAASLLGLMSKRCKTLKSTTGDTTREISKASKQTNNQVTI